MKRIAIIGSGKVGTATGMGFMQMGNEVLFQDISGDRLLQLSKQGLHTADDMEYILRQVEILFICVPTPSKDNGSIDLSHIITTIKEITETLKVLNVKRKPVIVIKSTVVPFTTERIILPILESSNKEFGLCVNPEFLTEISVSWSDDLRFQRDFWSKERIVIGQNDIYSGEVLTELYEPLGAPIFKTDLKTAEFIKYATNCILATKISYWNEIFLTCKELGIDSELVAAITALDSRISIYGTVHGKAFGGKCLPKDLSAFNDFVEDECGFSFTLLKKVQEVNNYMAKEYGVRE